MARLVCALVFAAVVHAAGSRQDHLQWIEAQPWRMDRNADPSKIETQKGIEFSRPDGEPSWIQVTTRVDVACGEDTSVYLYAWSGDHWARRFKLEPASPVDSLRLEASDNLVLVTGWSVVCTPAWKPFFVGLYRINSGQKTLLEGAENANPDGETSARLEPNGARVEYTGPSIDPVLSIRRHLLHFVVDSAGAHRADPLALSAQDFVDEWVSSPWREAAAWSAAGLGEIHDQLPKQGQMGAVQRCADGRNVWQVAVVLGNDWRYFRVSEPAEHQYRMIAVSATPCKAAKH